VRRWARTCVVVLGLAGVAAAGVMAVLLISGPASAHNNPCHSLQVCPSDHHDYVWFDPSSGSAWDCAEPGAAEYDPSLDTTTIAFDGLTYYCRPGTGVTTVTGATTNATTMASTVVQATTVATTLVQTGGTSQTSTTTRASGSQIRLGPHGCAREAEQAVWLHAGRAARSPLLARRLLLGLNESCHLFARLPDERDPQRAYIGEARGGARVRTSAEELWQRARDRPHRLIGARRLERHRQSVPGAIERAPGYRVKDKLENSCTTLSAREK
jgi:hypothetical protein